MQSRRRPRNRPPVFEAVQPQSGERSTSAPASAPMWAFGALALLAMLPLAACAGGEPLDTDDSKIVLTVVNRSVDEDPVGVRVTLDGELVFNEDVTVEDGHVEVEMPVESGEHVLVATSRSGVIHETPVAVEAGDTRWVLVTFRSSPDNPRHFTVDQQDEPFPTDLAMGTDRV